MKRYNPDIDSSDCYMGMNEHADGEFVKYEDIKHLIKKTNKEDYNAALCDIIDTYLYNAGAKQPTIDECFEKIIQLNERVENGNSL